MSIESQCSLIGLSRATFYYEPVKLSVEELALTKRVDELYTTYPFYGSRRVLAELRAEGRVVNRKHIQNVMRTLGLSGQLPGISTSKGHQGHKKYPYLLKGLAIVRPRQVWSTDITYIRLPNGFMYLVAVMDWYSRLVLSSRFSNSLDNAFCIEAAEEAFERYGIPEIFNTDQGVQFTSQNFVQTILGRGIQLSMDGRGRALDNVFVERLWRSLKYEDVYLNEYQNGREAKEGISRYWRFYNEQRLHQALGYRTPQVVHFGS